MKLIIQIPCLNEEATLPGTLAELPRSIDGVDSVEWLVIDDGSTDRTAEVARACGVDHIVTHTTNKGLAVAFQTGLDACLQAGADIIVNTDADNQYPGRFVPALVRPILEHSADMVIGNRQTDSIPHFSRTKRLLQGLGSRVVRRISDTDVPDAPSGFRAFSREAALRLYVVTGYTYTLETIMQAGQKNLTIAHVPVEVNPKTRESRLMRSTFDYVLRSTVTLLRLFLLHQPLRTFTYLSLPFFLLGGGLWLRYLILVTVGEAARGAYVQSVIVGAVALILGFLIFLIGLLGDVVAMTRRIQEETLYYTKRMALSNHWQPPCTKSHEDEVL